MSDLTVPRLMEIMRDCAGDSDSVDLSGDIENVDFTDLGYDSLARLETASRVEREYGVRLADGTVVEASTPREFLDLVNGAIASAS